MSKGCNPVDTSRQHVAWSRIDRYEIVGEVGRGGMGVVYHAYDATLDRSIALKMLSPELAHLPGFVERLRREAISIARLRHPHIALLYEFGQAADTTFLALEFVQGPSLRQLIEAGPLPTERVLHILKQIGDGLDYAHRKGIVHRDVKPSNILIGPDDHAVLIDFGLADLIEDGMITMDSTVLGTPHYMAPEQVAGYPADGRSDQYALAAVAYEMLIGVPPFHGRSATAVVHAHMYEPPTPPTELRPILPIAVNTVLLRGLAKEPHQRYPSLAAFTADLQAAFTSPALVRRPARGWLWWLAWLVPLALVLLILALVLPQTGMLSRQQTVDQTDVAAPLPRQVVWSHVTDIAGGPPLAVTQHTVVAGTLDGSLIALRADTGAIRWQRSGATPFGAPAASETLVFVGDAAGNALALSPESGGTVWQTKLIGAVEVAPMIVDDRIVLSTAKGYLYVLQASSGRVIWSRPLATSAFSPLVSAGRIMLSAGAMLYALDLRNGVVDWRFDAASQITTQPSVVGDKVIIGTERGMLHVLRLIDGTAVAQHQARGPVGAAPAASSTMLFVVDQGGSVTAIQQGSLSEAWRFDAGAAVTASPLLINGTLVVGASDGHLYMLDAQNGQQRALVQLSGSITTPPVFADGFIYVRGRAIYAVGP